MWNKRLPIYAALFIFCYFLLFTSASLRTYFTFDDGMNLIHLHRHWEVPMRTSVLDVLKVFTPAYRPLGALFYRPFYDLFGFNPLPFRIAAYLLMILNIVLAWRFAGVLGATSEACALSTLLFCYNGSMVDLYYNTGTIYDLMCFPLYIGAVLIYVRRRSILIVMLLYLAALDAKEMAITLPAVLLLYEVLYCYRDFKSMRVILRRGGFLLLMFAAAALYYKVKVAGMSGNALYRPHISVAFILGGMGHYFEQLLYLSPDSFGPVKVSLAFAALLAAAAALRSRPMAYGTLFFAIGLLPLSVIDHRTGYAAYVAYPGLTLAIAAGLASCRSALTRMAGRQNLEQPGAVVLFLCVAAMSIMSFAHTRKILIKNALWDEQRRIDLLTGLKQRIPEFPPNARILFLDDPWNSDWGPIFLTQLLYRDPSLTVDRVKNPGQGADRDSYDLLITYQQPLQGLRTPKLFGIKKTWDVEWFPLKKGEFALTGIRSAGISSGTLTVPGLSNVKIDAIYRTSSDGESTTHSVEGWCTLDSNGSCSVPATEAVDWVRPSKGRWIFTRGALASNEPGH